MVGNVCRSMGEWVSVYVVKWMSGRVYGQVMNMALYISLLHDFSMACLFHDQQQT